MWITSIWEASALHSKKKLSVCKITFKKQWHFNNQRMSRLIFLPNSCNCTRSVTINMVSDVNFYPRISPTKSSDLSHKSYPHLYFFISNKYKMSYIPLLAFCQIILAFKLIMNCLFSYRPCNYVRSYYINNGTP